MFKCSVQIIPLFFVCFYFKATSDSDLVYRNGIATTIQERLQTLTLMDIYSQKSIEASWKSQWLI